MSDDSEDEVYNVEKIVGHKIVDGKTLFRVRWEGYFPEEDTWEPFENVKGCVDALRDYRAERVRKTGKSTPKDLGAPVESDSSDSDAGAENSTASCSRILKMSSEDERPSTSISKKFRRISCIISSSDSDDDDESCSGLVKESTNKMVKEDTTKMKKKTSNTAELEKKSKAKEPFPVKTSNSQQPGKPENRVTKTVEQHTKASGKRNKKSIEEMSEVRPIQLVQDALKPKQKTDKPNVKSAHKPEKLRQFEHVRGPSDDPFMPKPKSVKKSKASVIEEDLSMMALDLTIHKPKPKAVKKPETFSPIEEDSISMNSNLATQKQKPGRTFIMEKDHSSKESDLATRQQKPKAVKKSSTIEKDIGLMDSDTLVSYPKPKSVQQSEKAGSFEGHSSKDGDFMTSKTKKKSSPRLKTPDVAEPRGSTPTKFFKKVKVPPKMVPKVGDDNKKRKRVETVTSLKTEEKYAANLEFSRPDKQPNSDQQLPAPESSTKRGESLTINTASAADHRDFNVRVGDKSDLLQQQASSKEICKQPKMPQEQCYEDHAKKVLKSKLEVLSDQIRWSPQLIDGLSCIRGHGDASNSSCSGTFGSLLTKTEGRPMTPCKNTQPFPTCADKKPKTKRKIEIKPQIQHVPMHVVESLHKHAKAGNFPAIAKWYDTPGKHDWEMVNPRGSTIVMQAAVNGRTDIVKLLLFNGADANARQSAGKTLMMLLCEGVCGPPKEVIRLAIVEMLIVSGGKMNLLDPHGETALMMACKKGYVEIVRSLLNFGADFYIKTKATPDILRKPMTALDFAKIDSKNNPQTSKEHLEIVQMLSSLEARVTAAFDAQVTLVLNNSGKLLEPLFDPTIFSCFEDTKFTLSFDYKELTFEPDTGLLLFVAHAIISLDEEIQCRMYGDVSAVSEIRLNGVRLIGITEHDHVLSFCPVFEGTNELELDTIDLQNSDVKLIVRAYKVQLIP